VGRIFGGIALAAIALSMVVAGCGGGDEEQTLTKAEFVKQSSAICKKGEERKNEQLTAALKAQTESGKPLKIGRTGKEALLSTVILPPLRQMSEELAELGIPEERSEEAEAIIKGFEDVIAELEENPGSALKSQNPFTEVNQLALDFGMNNCGAI